MNKFQLEKELRLHNAKYRLGVPDISDAEYDALVERLRAIDPYNKWLRSLEPAPVQSSRKRKLPIPMRSLNKVKSLTDLKKWMTTIPFTWDATVVITPKFDGLSLLVDETGRPKAYSRGGAENEGQDCTAHYNALLPQSAAPDGMNYSYGEFVFSRRNWIENFQGRTSSETGVPYKSPRNTAAGLLNREQPSPEIALASFYRYGADEESLKSFKSYADFYDMVCAHWNQPNLSKTVRAKDATEEMLHECFKCWTGEYFIDGLVIYVNDLSLWPVLGRHEGTGNPKYAIAYKHPDFTESFITIVKDVAWRISKSGALKPVVNIEAVDTGDCTMENPTGYNARWIESKGIGKGAEILVTRSGGVIPKILSTLKPMPVQIPVVCPECGTQLEMEGPELYCTNPKCDGIRLAKITHFFRTVGVEDIGDEIIAKLFAKGYSSIKSILDISADEILRFDGFGDGIAEIIIREMKKIKKGVELSTLMHASDCFKGIGRSKSLKILDEWKGESKDSWIHLGGEEIRKMIQESIGGPVTWQNFVAGIIPFQKFLADTGLRWYLKSEQAPTSSKYAGCRVCFSGVRDVKLENEIRDGGGEVMSNVNRKTTHLIVADLSSSSSKITKARELGSVIIRTISEFR